MTEPRRGSGSVAFDGAADTYDATRTVSPDAMTRVVEVLARELAGRGRCLEVGVGTGRVALPVTRAGPRLVGIDLSKPMLAKLVEKAGGIPFPLAVADAIALPFRDRAFGATFAAHVLHLIPPWRAAVAEMVRVTRHGGVVLIDRGGFGIGWSLGVERRFCAEAGIASRFRGLNEDDDLDAAMRELGTSVRALERIEESQEDTVEDVIRRLEEGVFSFTWSLDEPTRCRAAAATRAWAKETIGALDERRTFRRPIQWRAYDVP